MLGRKTIYNSNELQVSSWLNHQHSLTTNHIRVPIGDSRCDGVGGLFCDISLSSADKIRCLFYEKLSICTRVFIFPASIYFSFVCLCFPLPPDQVAHIDVFLYDVSIFLYIMILFPPDKLYFHTFSFSVSDIVVLCYKVLCCLGQRKLCTLAIF